MPSNSNNNNTVAQVCLQTNTGKKAKEWVHSGSHDYRTILNQKIKKKSYKEGK